MTSRTVRINKNNMKYKITDNYVNKCIITTKQIFINIILWMLVLTTFALLIMNNVCKNVSKKMDYIYLKSISVISQVIEYIDNNNKDNPRRSIIYDRTNKEPYLVRYYLLFKDREKFPFNVFIHKFIKGDDDEDPHDHPWGFFHIILSGGYWENVPMKISENKFDRGFCKVWRPAGYWNIVSSDYTHRIELRDGEPNPWTIFVPFKRNNHWGFWIKQNDTEPWVKQNNEDYLRNKDVTKKMD